MESAVPAVGSGHEMIQQIPFRSLVNFPGPARSEVLSLNPPPPLSTDHLHATVHVHGKCQENLVNGPVPALPESVRQSCGLLGKNP